MCFDAGPGANEFFSELAILPLEGGWKHRRTVVAMRNSMLYMLSRRAVDHIAINYSELKFQVSRLVTKIFFSDSQIMIWISEC